MAARAENAVDVAPAGPMEGPRHARYNDDVAQARNLADPDFEPSDTELVELSTRAFAEVREAHARSLAKLRAEIAAARVKALAALDRGRDAP